MSHLTHSRPFQKRAVEQHFQIQSSHIILQHQQLCQSTINQTTLHHLCNLTKNVHVFLDHLFKHCCSHHLHIVLCAASVYPPCVPLHKILVIPLSRLKNWTVFKSLTDVYYDSERQFIYQCSVHYQE